MNGLLYNLCRKYDAHVTLPFLNEKTLLLSNNHLNLIVYAVRWDLRIWFILLSNTPPQVKALWTWNLHRPTLLYV
jgi:hypothetical protein